MEPKNNKKIEKERVENVKDEREEKMSPPLSSLNVFS